MNRAEILQLAKFRSLDWYTVMNATDDDIVAFAEAIAAKEREECAVRAIETLKAYRFDKFSHLGLGDIRLTIGDQERIAEAVRGSVGDTE